MDRYPVYLTAMERALIVAVLEKTIEVCDPEFEKVHATVIKKVSAFPLPGDKESVIL